MIILLLNPHKLMNNRKDQVKNTFSLLTKYKAIIASLTVTLIGIILIAIPIVYNSENFWIILSQRIGIVLLTSALISFIFGFFFRQNFQEDMVSKVKSELKNYFETNNSIKESGILEFHRNLPIQDVVNSMSRSSTIKILQTWIPDLYHFEKPFREVVERGGSVEILLLDPRSNYAKQRSKDLEYPNDQYASDAIKANITDLSRYCSLGNIKNKIKIKMYSCLPSIQVYCCDEKAFIGFYMHKNQSTQSPQLEILMPHSVMGSRIAEEFNILWKSSKSIHISEWLADEIDTKSAL